MAFILFLLPLVAYKDLKQNAQIGIDALNDYLYRQGSIIVLSMTDFQAGKYASEFKLNVEFSGVLSGSCIEIDGVILHSPLTLLSLKKIDADFTGAINTKKCPQLNHSNISLLTDLFPNGVFKGNTTIGFNDVSDLSIQTYDFSYANKHHSIEIAPVYFQHIVDNDGEQIESFMHWLGGTLLFRETDISSRLPEIKSEGRVKYSDNQLVSSDGTMTIDSFEIQSSDLGRSGFDGIKISAGMADTEGKMQINSNLMISELSIYGEFIGTLSSDIDLLGLDSNYLYQTIDTLNRVDTTGKDLDATYESIILELVNHLVVRVNNMSLLANDAVLEMQANIKLENPDNVRVNSTIDLSFNQPMIQHIAHSQSAITLKSQGITDEVEIGRYSEQATMGIEALLNLYVAQGNIDSDDSGNFKTHIKLQNNKLWMNDKFVQLPQ